MNKKIKLIVFFLSSVLFLNTSSASADPTYAMLDANGNITNIIVCGEACSGGTWMGQKVVLQVAADPITNESRAGHWGGQSTYNSDTGIFTINNTSKTTEINSETVIDLNNNEIILTTEVYHNNGYQFKYEDTTGINGLTPDKIVSFYNSDETDALISASNNQTTESILFENRKTNEQILEVTTNSGLSLLISQVQILISLLGSWVK